MTGGLYNRGIYPRNRKNGLSTRTRTINTMNTMEVKRALLLHAGVQERELISASAGTVNWLKEIGAGQEIIEYCSDCLWSRTIDLNGGSLFGEEDMVAYNKRLPHVTNLGLLMIGSECSGDIFTLRLKDAQLGYFSHEEVASTVFGYQDIPFPLEELIEILASARKPE